MPVLMGPNEIAARVRALPEACRKAAIAHSKYIRNEEGGEPVYMFTWGGGHEPFKLGDYTIIKGSKEETREKMVRKLGVRWSMQYPATEIIPQAAHAYITRYIPFDSIGIDSAEPIQEGPNMANEGTGVSSTAFFRVSNYLTDKIVSPLAQHIVPSNDPDRAAIFATGYEKNVEWTNDIVQAVLDPTRDEVFEHFNVAIAAAASYGATGDEAANDRVQESARTIARLLGAKQE